jgi:hypothetical protein
VPGHQKKWYAVKIGFTPGFYEDWALAKAEINPPKFLHQAVHKSFAKLDEAIRFMGGEALYKAWTAFSAGKLDDAEELFKLGDPSGHGAFRIRCERADQVAAATRAEEQRLARVTQEEAAADLRVREDAEAAARATVRAEHASAARKADEDAAVTVRAEAALAGEVARAWLGEKITGNYGSGNDR